MNLCYKFKINYLTNLYIFYEVNMSCKTLYKFHFIINLFISLIISNYKLYLVIITEVTMICNNYCICRNHKIKDLQLDLVY